MAKAPTAKTPAKASKAKAPTAKTAKTAKTKAGAPGARDKLATYKAKRDFAVTSEPQGAERLGEAPTGTRRFVVQRHRATRRHYDLRLELDGVLVSWAVPKGPTLDPDVRSLAVHVEDHPLDYFDFEGVIPKGEYGGGDVIVWDWGTWEPADGKDPAQMLADGGLHVDLFGEKLAGRFALVRTGGRGGAGAGKDGWLLLHKHDEHAVKGWDPEAHPRSVRTGRTNDEVAADRDAVWHSDRTDGYGEGAAQGAGSAKGGAKAKAPAARAKPRTGANPWARQAKAKRSGPTAVELRALAELDGEGDWPVRGRTLHVTNLDKELVPGRDGEPPITKREIIAYYATVAPAMLPYLVGRSVNMHRFPNGSAKPGFWHKAIPNHAPEWLNRWTWTDSDGDRNEYIIADEVGSLVWLANFGAIELHPWTSRVEAPTEPTWALIDIDPGPKTAWADTLVLARLYRTALDHLGVEGIPKVTGQRGIQVWIPVADGHTFEQTSDWVQAVSRSVGAVVPDLVSWSWQKGQRAGLARLDYTQNAINKTLVAPWSLRPAPGAPVSVPIEWAELDDPDLRPDRWTIRTALQRLDAVGDPLQRLVGRAQELPSI
jgi:bifunctional non-homologous end joining protein LigD